ncbi:peroxisomal hydratase-dehydrogenase-epimerase [Neodiprion lecontei]|uniref:Peroxisomal hydratase-dehydrogenase-epimerase n=1 Tax=Neodiprion lecontei TaxID=441921 RepID=A0A6J0BMX3_NEOLC|nr:peroxisomal hydratase-dehydrogenase-epimerase [Neodiprion lecontei]
MDPIANKVVLITGGANGIGFAYATEFLRNGAAHVAILDLANSKGDESAKKLNAEFGPDRAIFIVCDVTKQQEFEDAFAKVVKEFGGLDIVINNAGIMDDARWELMIEINITAVVRGTLLAFRYMGKDKGGKGGTLVNVSSVAGLVPAMPFPIYGGTKHAVIGISRSFGHPYHYDKSEVRILTMCPGGTETQLVTKAGGRMLDMVEQQAVSDALGSIPIQRPESVAKGMMEIIKVGKSGSVWLVNNGEPACEVDIPDSPVTKASISSETSDQQYNKPLRSALATSLYRLLRSYSLGLELTSANITSSVRSHIVDHALCSVNIKMAIENKIALVTGGANGIGLEYVKALLRNGAAHVAILDLANSNGDKVVSKLNEEFGKGKVIFIVCDVTKPEDLEAGFAKTVKEFGGLDIVINNAGIMDDSRWELMIDINLNAVVRGVLLGLKYMGKDNGGKGGTIVNIASIAGLVPVTIFPIYAATKHAIIGLSRSFGQPYHYEKSGVRFVTVCPSATNTQLITKSGGRILKGVVDEKEHSRMLSHFGDQSPEFVANEVMKMIRNEKNGSAWLVANGEPAYEVDIPDTPVRKAYLVVIIQCTGRGQEYKSLVSPSETINLVAEKLGSRPKMFTIKNKSVLITGGANGLGFAYATELLRNGAARVAVLDLKNSNGEEAEKKLNSTSGNGKALFIVCDVTKPEELEAAFAKTVKEFGGLDIVINNAGIMDDSRWELMININLTALTRGTLLGLKYMGKDNNGKGGVIVNVSSVLGLMPIEIFPIYSGTKHAVVGLTRSFAKPYHYDRTGVRMLTVCPGAADTQLLTQCDGRTLDCISLEAIQQIKAAYPVISTDEAAKGMIHVIQKAENGGVWIIESGKPPYEAAVSDYPTAKIPTEG